MSSVADAYVEPQVKQKKRKITVKMEQIKLERGTNQTSL